MNLELIMLQGKNHGRASLFCVAGWLAFRAGRVPERYGRCRSWQAARKVFNDGDKVFDVPSELTVASQ
ncbi:hypothetical protein TNCT_113701 [Trichonephila clavata]|uniref:Uncharacterized protein n=1 Tax=Trichonephila clavata TaxID=2740835 RepID=A0A8X6KPN9_TRICU|nr:hypothetical protein TNCT_113701 [Trichonephila clavata]